ncbi:hypothetical protein ACHAXR_005576 [Thalassiosira sp. AJA248-18]
MAKPTSKSKAAAVALTLAALCGTIAFFSKPSINNLPIEQSSSSSSSVIDIESPLAASIEIPSSSSSSHSQAFQSSSSSPNHRRLSKSLPNGGCEITWPQKPPPGIPITYAASYPGCGARMTWNLVEALTGLWTGDDWNNNGRGSEVVTVKTHYPQSNGILVDFDQQIMRGFIVVRNPMKSIPSFFNHIYEMRNHLPVHSERAPLEEWIKWRNAYLDIEIAEYKKFIIYWMDRFPAGNRLLITYEGLTDDLIGAEVTKGLNDFLGAVDGIDPIERDSVPCIWRAVVKNEPPPQQKAQIEKLQSMALNQPQNPVQAQGGTPVQQQAPPQQPIEAAPVQQQAPPQQPIEAAPVQQQQPPPQQVVPQAAEPQQQYQQQPAAQAEPQQQYQQQPAQVQPGLRRRLDPGHHDSQRKGPPIPRPYTPEQLDKMMNMLLEVAEKYHSEDVRLYHIMMGYYEKIKVERTKLSPGGVELVAPPGGFY